MKEGEGERRVCWGSSRSGNAFVDSASWAPASVCGAGECE